MYNPGMLFYLKLFYGIMRLRNTPQDLPASRALFWLTLGFYVSLGMFEGVFVYRWLKNALFNAFDIVLLLLFLHFLLSFTHHLPRFNQTATAVFGVSAGFRLFELPAYLLLVNDVIPDTHPLYSGGVLFILLLRMVNVFVNGHILAHALATTLLEGVLWALGFFFAGYFLVELVFPR
jgi:hypothetical protein